MTVAENTVAAQITISSTVHQLDVLDGSSTLDEGWAPYAQAPLTIAIPSQTVLDGLDPRLDPRVLVTATHKVAAFGLDQTRTFDLLVRGRTLDEVAATVTLSLASDEALLQDLANVTSAVDTTALAYQSSVRGIINSWLLPKIGAALESGTIDADFTTLTSVTNLLLDPGAEVVTANWATGGGATISRTTTQFHSGASSCMLTATGTGSTVYLAHDSTGVSATVGAIYSASAYVRSNTAGASATITLRYLDASNTQISAVTGGSVTVLTTGWARVSVAAAAAPTNCVRVVAFVSFTGTASGRLMYVDDGMLTDDSGLETDGVNIYAPFNGDTTDTALYNYQWTSTANASTSTRTPVFQRDPQTLSWTPGESAFDFIQPVLTQAGLRLFCDEQRKWRLVDKAFSVSGLITVAEGFNAYAATDTISRDAKADDGSPLWFDSVVVKYVWNDTNNIQQVRYDVANDGSPSQTALFEYDRPYPGPGAAAYLLSRVNGQGRVLDLTAAFDLVATPGMAVSATLPNIPIQTGYCSSVKWDFAADEMKIGSRGLTDTPPNAWALTSGSWASQSSSWASATT